MQKRYINSNVVLAGQNESCNERSDPERTSDELLLRERVDASQHCHDCGFVRGNEVQGHGPRCMQGEVQVHVAVAD